MTKQGGRRLRSLIQCVGKHGKDIRDDGAKKHYGVNLENNLKPLETNETKGRSINFEIMILAVDHSVKFPAFLFKVVTLYDSLPQDLTLKYQPSDKDLNALIYVTNDNDLKHMMHEYVLVLTLPERIQVIPNGIYGAIVQTAGWTATSSQSHIKFDSSGLTRDGLSKNFFHRPSKAYTTGIRKRRKIQNEYDLQGAETRWHKTGKTRLVMVNGKQKGCKLSANCKLQVAICQLCT
ncbi:hypothetical protein JHK82_043321 [Glycine max]|nr:hypothetical protein JHK82_043321 [Glycine max]